MPRLETAFKEARRGALGAQIEWYQELASTSALLREKAEGGAPAGLVIASELQTAGRGQRSRIWDSAAGGLWFSVLLRPQLASPEVAQLMPDCGQAIAHALRHEYGLEGVHVKFPNDVLLKGRKVSGVLAEAASRAGDPNPEFVVLGLGINVSNPLPPPLASLATTLAQHLAKPPARPELLAVLLQALETHLDSQAIVLGA